MKKTHWTSSTYGRPAARLYEDWPCYFTSWRVLWRRVGLVNQPLRLDFISHMVEDCGKHNLWICECGCITGGRELHREPTTLFLPLKGYSSKTPPMSKSSVPTNFRMAMCLKPMTQWKKKTPHLTSGDSAYLSKDNIQTSRTLCRQHADQLCLIPQSLTAAVYYWNHSKPWFVDKRRTWWSGEFSQKSVSAEARKPKLNTEER